MFPLTGRAPPRATLTRHALPPESRPGAWPLTQTVVGAIQGSWWVTERTPEVILSAISSHGCRHLSGTWTFIIRLSLVGTLELLWGHGLSAILQMRKLSPEEFRAFPGSQSE